MTLIPIRIKMTLHYYTKVLLLGEIEPTKYTRLIDQIQEHLGVMRPLL